MNERKKITFKILGIVLGLVLLGVLIAWWGGWFSGSADYYGYGYGYGYSTPIPTPIGNIFGQVTDSVTRKPIDKAKITLGNLYYTYTDIDGFFNFNDKYVNHSNIKAVKEGYKEYFEEVSILPNQTVIHNVELESENPSTLKPINVRLTSYRRSKCNSSNEQTNYLQWRNDSGEFPWGYAIFDDSEGEWKNHNGYIITQGEYTQFSVTQSCNSTVKYKILAIPRYWTEEQAQEEDIFWSNEYRVRGLGWRCRWFSWFYRRFYRW